MSIKFNIPRQQDYATCSTHQPRYVRVVPEATWQKIVKVLNQASNYTGNRRHHFDLSDAVDALRKHLERKS